MSKKLIIEAYAILEQKMREEVAKLEAVLSSMNEGLVAYDNNFSIILANQAASVILRKAPGDLYQTSVHRALCLYQGNKELSDANSPITLSAKKGIINIKLGDDYYIKNKDGSLVPITMSVATLAHNSQVKNINGVAIFRNASDDKLIDRAKTEFVSLASHQLRTPLSTINWYVEMLLAGDAGQVTSDQKKYLEEIYHGNQRMVELVNALLNVSRLELGTFVIEPELTDVILLTRSVMDEQKPQIAERKIAISSLFEKNIPLVPVDPKLLRMVVQNLLSNAVKYTPDGGKIEVSLSLNNKKNLLFKISDTGYGIPRSQQDKIFTKLFRADNVREKDTEGTGLGLYIVKSIVEHSGGKIWFESEENGGTTFYVTLPLS